MLYECNLCNRIHLPHLPVHTVTCIQVQCSPQLWQLHFVFRDFNDGVCHIMKDTIAETNLDVGLFAVAFSSHVRILGECLTIYFTPVLFFLLFF